LPQLTSAGARLIRVDAQASRVRRRTDNILTLEPFIALLVSALASSVNPQTCVLNFLHGFSDADVAPLNAQVPKVSCRYLKAPTSNITVSTRPALQDMQKACITASV